MQIILVAILFISALGYLIFKAYTGITATKQKSCKCGTCPMQGTDK